MSRHRSICPLCLASTNNRQIFHFSQSMPSVLINKIRRIVFRKANALAGRLYPLNGTLEAIASRPFELHLELTNLCNANCLFCPYQFQEREIQFMSDTVFEKAVADYLAIGGGSV